jgi:hypothetical protein
MNEWWNAQSTRNTNPILIVSWLVPFLRGEETLMFAFTCIHALNSLTHLHIPCNTTHSPRPILLGVDAGVPCRRSSAPPRLAKRRRLRLLLVVVLLPHQHQHRLRNLRQNPPTSRQMSRSLPLPYLNPRQSRSPPQPLRNQRLRPPNNRPCDSRSRDNMCDSQIL